MSIQFSIVTPVLNRRKELERMVQSVLAQSFKDYELIIVDNGSTDGTWEYCQKLHDTHGITVVQCKKRGVSFARNEGIRKAVGEWVLILDSDNKFLSNHSLESLASYVNGFPQALCILTRNQDRDGKLISFCKKLDRYLSLREYMATSGEFSAVVRTSWFKQNLYPEIDGARTEFPACVYAKAALEKRLVVSEVVAQIYSTEADNRICSTPLTKQRTWELHHYYKMLLGSYSKHLVFQAPLTWLAWSFKYLVYGRLSGTLSLRQYLKSHSFVGWLPFWFIPNEWLRRLVRLAKARF